MSPQLQPVPAPQEVDPSAVSMAAPRESRWHWLRPSLITRLLIAIGFLGIAAWHLNDRVFSTVSIDGAVMSPVVVLRSPIDGQVTSSLAKTGMPIEPGLPLLTIENKRIDDRVRLDVERRLKTARFTAQGIARRHGDLVRTQAVLADRVESHRAASVSRLEAMRNETTARHQGALANLDRARSEIQRAKQLVSGGSASKVRLEDAVMAEQTARSQVDMFEASIKRIDVDLASAQSGVMMGEGYGDAPYSQQRLDEIKIRIFELKVEYGDAVKRMEELEQSLTQEDDRLSKLRDVIVRAPSHGLIWNVRVTEGSEISRNDALADVVDCNHSFVEATISERTYDRIQIGQHVSVRLNGNSRRIDGIVRSVRGSAANVDRSLRAAVLGRVNADAMTVVVELTHDGLMEATSSNCHVGRAAVVYFDNPDRKPGTIASVLAVIREFTARLAPTFRL
jgi:multidrug resistance efflux pump